MSIQKRYFKIHNTDGTETIAELTIESRIFKSHLFCEKHDATEISKSEYNKIRKGDLVDSGKHLLKQPKQEAQSE